MSKTMVIKGGNIQLFDAEGGVYKYYHEWAYRKAFRIIRKILRKIHLGILENFFYGDWKRNIKVTSTVILFDNKDDYSDRVPKFIRKKNKNIKIVFWYWNPVSTHDDVLVSSKYIDEIWSYSRFDSEKYGLKYNPQFYYPVQHKKDKEVESDIVFLGKEKNRKTLLDKVKKEAESQGLKCNFSILKRSKVQYADYIGGVLGSRCILDLVPDQSCGLTLRPLEALYYGKKLITNYNDIVNYDFYNEKNIFILDKDDIAGLNDFVKSPYEEVDKKVVDYYSYNNWLRRIEGDKSEE